VIESDLLDTGVNVTGMSTTFNPNSVRVSHFQVLVLVLSALVDVTQKIVPGAMVTLLYLAWCWIPLGQRVRDLRSLRRTLYPLLFFLLWAGLSLLLHPFSISGLQNLAVLAAFLGFILFNSTAGVAGKADCTVVLPVSAWLCCSVYAISAVFTRADAESLAGARSFALFALFGVAWYLAGWCTRSHLAVIYALLMLLLIAVSLSRTAFVAGALLFSVAALMVAYRRRAVRFIIITAALGAVLTTLVLRLTDLTQRFSSEEETVASVEVGDLDLDTSGRLVMWSVIWGSFVESPWTGKGAGTASDLLQDTLSGITHPHCDYLRILHDYGVLGLSLFIAGVLKLFAALWKIWRASAAQKLKNERFHLATLFAFGALVLAMLTDNCMSYIYLMAPIAIMIGASLRGHANSPPVLAAA
jgi:O-antigen ligase